MTPTWPTPPATLLASPLRPNAGHSDASMLKITSEETIWCADRAAAACSHTLQASSNRICRVPKPIFPATRQTTLTNSCKQVKAALYFTSHFYATTHWQFVQYFLKYWDPIISMFILHHCLWTSIFHYFLYLFIGSPGKHLSATLLSHPNHRYINLTMFLLHLRTSLLCPDHW